MASSPTKISLKLLIDKKGQRVLFAEAGKDFVDFLFHILSLPLGSVVKIVSKDNMVGSLGRLYGSIETMNDIYIQPDVKVSSILNPQTLKSPNKIPLLLACGNSSSTSSNTRDMYRCSKYGCSTYVTDDPRTICLNCYTKMNTKMTFLAGPSSAKDEKAMSNEGGYVKGIVTYMIMDDLSVKPMSTISSITLLSTFNVKDLASLEEKMVYVSMIEGVELLKTSMHSDTVLTDVFLTMKKKKKGRR